MKIQIELNELQNKKLDFIKSQFNGHIKVVSNNPELQKLWEESQNEAILITSLNVHYKKCLDEVNQGNDHDGLPLVEEII